jgi:hypothetical protein
MEKNKKSPQTAATVSEDKVEAALQPIYDRFDDAEKIIDFAILKDWSEERLLLAIKIIQLLKHFR